MFIVIIIVIVISLGPARSTPCGTRRAGWRPARRGSRPSTIIHYIILYYSILHYDITLYLILVIYCICYIITSHRIIYQLHTGRGGRRRGRASPAINSVRRPAEGRAGGRRGEAHGPGAGASVSCNRSEYNLQQNRLSSYLFASSSYDYYYIVIIIIIVISIIVPGPILLFHACPLGRCRRPSECRRSPPPAVVDCVG